MIKDNKTTSGYWNRLYDKQSTPSLPSRFSVGSKNLKNLFHSYITPGMRVLEIGCAPGKQLGYIGLKLGASVSGIDYSEKGIDLSRRLFNKLNLKCDLRCENIFETTFTHNSFDVVYSLGVAEHFENPSNIIKRHIELVRPGGLALISIPHYGGIYGRLQKYFDSENLGIHNLEIMNSVALKKFVPVELSREIEVFPFGRISPWLVNIERKWPAPLSLFLSMLVNVIGLLQPMDIRSLCPLIVLKIIKSIEP